jgi:hypothetical protein
MAAEVAQSSNRFFLIDKVHILLGCRGTSLFDRIPRARTISVLKITFSDENGHLFLLFSVNTKKIITIDPVRFIKCPFEEQKRET